MRFFNIKQFSVVLLLLVLLPSIASAQRIGISTDVVKLATLSPNIELDLNINQKSTISFKSSFNPITFRNGNKFKHISIAPEYKYWLQQVMSGSYLGIEGRYTTCDLAVGDKSWRSDILSIGINYGYSIVINNKFNLVPHIGAGYGLRCSYGTTDWKHTIIPQLGVNLQYIIYRPKR